MILTLHPFDLYLRHAFTISRESRTVQRTLIVELSDGVHSGYGEATANPHYYGVSIEGMVEVLTQLKPVIESAVIETPEAFWAQMEPHLREHPFALCALDVAVNDLFARQRGLPLYKYWGLNLDHLPMSNYTIGIASIEEMAAKMEEQPWPLYKIKLGTANDLEIIRELRSHTDAVFRVDANCAWTPEQTIAFAPELKALGVEFIEQPLKAEDWEGMREVYAHSALTVIADESCRVETDVDRCQGYFHGINIKLMKCGGLTPARRMITRARQLGLKVMVGCMTESSVGISAIAQLLPLLDYVDMDGAILLREDIATGVCLSDGKAHFPDLPGTGVRLIGSNRNTGSI